ncbi:MAG TPA: CpsD/CapB family tyrosine-protein kinase [Gemmataceae bacterium]|nr:CpsD/CapB family tyrosine-protein kinase [Gemmataceae bacterium]
MGRMLEAFRLVGTGRTQPTNGAPAPHLDSPRAQSVAPAPSSLPLKPFEEERESESEVEVPFIEVGGPRETMEASPQVLAARANLKPTAAGPVGPRLRFVARPPVAETPAPPAAVVFRPLPTEPAPRTPAARRLAPELIAFHQAEHPVSEEYRAMVDSMAGQLSAERPQVVLFTALAPEVDTTTVVLNVAITFARQGKLRVAVVDGNLRRPALGRQLGLPESPGIREFLAGNATLAQAVRQTVQPNLFALTAGAGETPHVLSDGLRPVLRQIRERFDLIVLDAPCWDGGPDMVALGAACDATYLVIAEADADTDETDAWVRTIPQHGARLRGCIVTKK